MARPKSIATCPKSAPSTLEDVVHIDRRFHRSIRIDQDLHLPEAIEGYIVQHSSAEVLTEIARTIQTTQQRAFTLTGPYGGGKSSLAVVLGDFLSPDETPRRIAEKVLGQSLSNTLRKAFPIKRGGWLVIPVQGRRSNPIHDIAQALAQSASKPSLKPIDKERDLISAIIKVAKDCKGDGVLLILDELGKYLEAIADGNADIHFFQELAEAASRSATPLVVIGILHQAFDGYVMKFGMGVRNEWAKVQGRYVDIPFRSAPDESIYLLGKAIRTEHPHPHSWKISRRVADQIQSRRAGSPKDLNERLDECWPLHPLLPSLLGAFSKKRFGQNERSIFGFLTSQEPYGFQSFLRDQLINSKTAYDPSRFWDYLRSNLEPAVLASSESHRWSLAVQTVERAEASGSMLQVQAAKIIATMDFFYPGDPGADIETLCSCFPEESERAVREVLLALEKLSAIIYRKHLKSWAIFAGSDFDIGAALINSKNQLAEVDLARLSRLAPMGPIVAKRHYHTTGAFRWFSFDIVRASDLAAETNPRDDDGKSGRFLLVLPTTPGEAEGLDARCKSASQRNANAMIAIGVPRNADLILDLGLELLALHQINGTDTRLTGDEVARREVQGHIADLDLKLERELQHGFTSASWYVEGKRFEITGKDSLTAMASDICDKWFDQAPRIFSELVNRHKPTRNSQAGVRELLSAMVKKPNELHLGIEGYPAERGLYDTVLAYAGLHRPEPGPGLGFCAPDPQLRGGSTYMPFWQAGKAWLREIDGLTSIDGLFDLWAAPPYGIHRGVLPILGLAFLLCHRDELAIHSEAVFQTEDDLRDGTFVDCLYRDAGLIQVRYVPPSNPERQKWLREVAQVVCTVTGRSAQRDSLAIAQQLKAFSDRLHPWVHKTKHLSKPALAIRQILLKASDPNKLIFEDLPNWHASNASAVPLQKCLPETLNELGGAYERMLRSIEKVLWEALGVGCPVDYKHLRTRAERVHGVSGDLRMDAYAGRLAELDGSSSGIESLCGFALNKPTRDWLGNDPDQAKFQIIELSDRFRKTETFADFCGKDIGRQGMALIVREGKKYSTMIQYFDVGDEDQGRLREVVANFKRSLNDAGLNSRLKLAALAAVTADILSANVNTKK